MWNLRDDLRFTGRSLGRRPATALFAVAILALPLAAATSVFTLVEAVLVRELPFRDADRLVWMWNARVERDRAPFSIPDLEDYRAQNRVLDGLAPFTNWTANLTGVGDAERLEGVRVAPEFFDVLGAEAQLGRLVHAQDDPDERVAVITDHLWRRRFAADPAIVGRSIVLSGTAYTVAGVLPPAFVFPFRAAEIAVPLALGADPRRAQRGAGFLRVVARLGPGVTIAAARADLDAIARRLRRQYPVDDGKKTGVNLYALQSEIVGDARQLLLTLLAATALLLLVACANLTNLLTVSLSARRTELQVCTALGAPRSRLVRQLLTETAVATIVAGGVGIALAGWLVRVLVWYAGSTLPRLGDVGLEPRSVAFGGLVTALAGMVCGVVPAISVTKRLEAGAAGEKRGVTATVAEHRLRRAFVAAQIAASLVLLVAIGLTLRSFITLQQVDPGFRADRVLAIQLSLPPQRYASPAALITFAEVLSARLAAIPGVRQPAAVSLPPLSGLLRTEDFRVIGRPDPPPDEVPQAHFRIVTPGYFRTVGIGLAAGREFDGSDRRETARVGIVSRSLADRFWPDGQALGARLRVGDDPAPVRIVGIAADVKQFSLDAPPTWDLYVPLRQLPAGDVPLVAARMSWVLSASGDPAMLVDAARREIRAVDGEIATSSARTLQQIVDDTLAPRRFNAALLGLFAQGALFLVAAGVYAVTSHAAQRRTREVGVRIAFGASRRDVLLLVVGSECRAIGAGLAAGALAAAVAGWSLSRSLFGVDAFEPGTLAAAVLLSGAVAIAASYLPARRAAAADPVETLRME